MVEVEVLEIFNGRAVKHLNTANPFEKNRLLREARPECFPRQV